MRSALAHLARHRRALDRWAVVYLVASAFYPFLNPAAHPAPIEAALLHLGLALAIWIVPPLLRRSRFPAVRLLGEIYLPFLFPLFYAEMEHLGLVFYAFPDSLDPWFIQLEELIFGTQPSLAWSRSWPWPWLHELMQFAYFSYYLFSVVALAMILSARRIPDRRRWPALRSLVRDLSAVMLVCYSLYTFFPVWGPKYFRAGPVPVDGWIFTRIMEHIHASGAILGAAFPSSHVAGTVVPWWHIWRWFPEQRWWVTALFLVMCASTVYCRYHYVVDVMAGLLLGGGILALTSRMRDRE